MSKRFFRLAVAGGLLASAIASAQTPPAPAANPMTAVWAAFNEGKYLTAIAALERATCDARGDGLESPHRAAHLDLLNQMRPMLSGYAIAPPIEEGSRALSQAVAADLRRAELSDAISTIRRAAARTSIVILNEAHHSPRDRVFALQVARALRPLGYSILAAEGFSNAGGEQMWADMAELERDGYPRLKTGVYTKDPVFGDFVRQSLALGYRPAAYEQTGEQHTPGGGISEREQAQAENLAAIMARHRGAKILVFVGFSHAAEAPIPHGEGQQEWMAARLKRLTGVDPLTIDQTTISEIAPGRDARQAYDLLAGRIRRPSVIKVDNKPYARGIYRNAVDLQVVHPRLELVGGRPVWLRSMGRRLRPIPASLLPTSGRRLVQAFLREEATDAVPVEQVVVEAGKPAPRMMLPDKPVRFAAQDSGGAGCR